MDRILCSPGFGRRQLARRRLVPLVALLALTPALGARDAGATRSWCMKDPVVKIAGRTADIYLSSYTELEQAATGPATIVVSVPVGVAAELLAADPGFGGFGYDVRFVEDGALKWGKGGPQLRVDAYVPSSDDSLPLNLDFEPRSSDLAEASARGSVNAWVSLKTR